MIQEAYPLLSLVPDPGNLEFSRPEMRLSHMQVYTLTHLSDAVLLRDLAVLVAQDRLTTATLLAHIAEVDARRLYVPAGYSSMHAYCVDELHLSEDAAYKRIQAARACRQFPVLFVAIAEARLHLAGVCLLAPHLTPQNLDELVPAASHRRKSEIEEMLARRFSPVPAAVRSITPVVQLAPGQVGSESSARGGEGFLLAARETIRSEDADGLAPGKVGGARMDAVPERYLLQVTIDKSTREKLRQAQALLSHAVPSGDVAQVLDRALESLIVQTEKRKVGAHPPRRQRPSRPLVRSRYIPAPVRRAVWERDQGQCTFVSPNGHRCKECRFLEFDHIDPYARGGRPTVDRMRLRCRAHNQYEAERAFGADFMNRKRRESHHAAEEARSRTDAKNEAAKAAAAGEQARDVLAGLRSLGCRADEARRAAAFTETLPNATLEERMRSALAFLGRRSIQSRPLGGSAEFQAHG